MSDLRAGAEIIDRLCKRAGKNDVPWNFVHGLYEQAIYGGRVDNPFDIKVTYSTQYLSIQYCVLRPASIVHIAQDSSHLCFYVWSQMCAVRADTCCVITYDICCGCARVI